MRKLIYSMNLSLDGCCDHTKGVPDEELHQYYADLLRESDTFLYGRVTYELMVPYWPDVAKNKTGGSKATQDFAKAFDEVKEIVVFSKTLKTDDKRTRVLSSGLEEEVMRLKQQPGKNIATGGVDIPEQLTQLGLIDEYYIMIQPIIVGEGRRLWDGLKMDMMKLKLVEQKTLKSGCVALHYVKK